MSVLFKGTKILMNLISDWITVKHVITDEGKIEEIYSCKHPSFETRIEMEIEIKDNYNGTDFRLAYEWNEIKYISDKITGVHIYYKKLEELKRGYFTTTKMNDLSCIVTTEDGMEYYFDIL